MTEARYRHRQWTWLVLAISTGVVLLVMTIALWDPPASPAELRFVAGLLILILAPVNVIFSSLLVEVAGGRLRVVFGPGVRVKDVSLEEIASVEAVRTPWWYGYGIRFTPSGVLYNVAGPHAVEVRLRSGRAFRVGTDEPDRLLEALRANTAPSTPDAPSHVEDRTHRRP